MNAAGGAVHHRLIRELLRRVAAAGLADRFALRAVCPRDAARFVEPLGALVDRGIAEQVREGCGRWHYRLTPAGAEAARTGVVPKPAPMPGREEREPHQLGAVYGVWSSCRRYRGRAYRRE